MNKTIRSSLPSSLSIEINDRGLKHGTHSISMMSTGAVVAREGTRVGTNGPWRETTFNCAPDANPAIEADVDAVLRAVEQVRESGCERAPDKDLFDGEPDTVRVIVHDRNGGKQHNYKTTASSEPALVDATLKLIEDVQKSGKKTDTNNSVRNFFRRFFIG